jgi:hypothetical protein
MFFFNYLKAELQSLIHKKQNHCCIKKKNRPHFLYNNESIVSFGASMMIMHFLLPDSIKV